MERSFNLELFCSSITHQQGANTKQGTGSGQEAHRAPIFPLCIQISFLSTSLYFKLNIITYSIENDLNYVCGCDCVEISSAIVSRERLGGCADGSSSDAWRCVGSELTKKNYYAQAKSNASAICESYGCCNNNLFIIIVIIIIIFLSIFQLFIFSHKCLSLWFAVVAETVGRGDKRTWRGKVFKGSNGKTRPDPRAERLRRLPNWMQLIPALPPKL